MPEELKKILEEFRWNVSVKHIAEQTEKYLNSSKNFQEWKAKKKEVEQICYDKVIASKIFEYLLIKSAIQKFQHTAE